MLPAWSGSLLFGSRKRRCDRAKLIARFPKTSYVKPADGKKPSKHSAPVSGSQIEQIRSGGRLQTLRQSVLETRELEAADVISLIFELGIGGNQVPCHQLLHLGRPRC